MVALVLVVLLGASLPHSPIPDPILLPLCSPKYSVFCAASLIFCSWVVVVVVGVVGWWGLWSWWGWWGWWWWEVDGTP